MSSINISREDLLQLTWNSLVGLCLVSSFILIPLAFCFPHQINFSVVAIDIFTSLVFAIDYFLGAKYKFHSVFTGQRKRYSITEKRLLLLASLPFTSVLFAFGISSSYIVGFQFLRFFKAKFTYLRLKKMVEHLMLPSAVKTISILNFCLGCIHWIACGWILMHPPEGIDNITIYNKSLYWAITTLTTIGYGDITPTTNLSRIYTMIIMLLGVGLYGLLIAQVSRLMITSDKRAESNKEKLENLTGFLKHYRVPYHLQQQVFGYYRHLLTKRLNEGETQILAELPGPLQTELKTYMMMQPISNVILFKDCSFTCIKDVSEKLEEVYYAPGKKIISKNDKAQEMYIIVHGDVEVNKEGVNVANLHSGQCFGEMSLILGGQRTADITAQSHCDLYRLDRDAFESILDKHSDLRANVEALIAERLGKAS